MGEFYYPYSFTAAPGRDQAKGDVGDRNPLADGSREDHSRYWSDRYTGVIPVVLRTQTPLFITDPESESSSGDHSTYSCLKHIPATALKGMLSSAYEIITNSRFRVFKKEQHDSPLGYRSNANATLVPARVERGDDGQLCAVLFTGTSSLSGRPNPLYAAWLPAYQGNFESSESRALKNGGEYMATLRRWRYSRGRMSFDLWSVEEIDGKKLAPITRNASKTDDVMRDVEGWVVKSGKIFTRKHDERFFFNAPGMKVHRLPLDEKVVKAYKVLIENYQKTHERDTKKGTLGKHATNGNSTLRGGEFVYADVVVDGGKPVIKGLYPVQISRKLYSASPWECLDPGLHPAKSLEQLSPADRLFGWVAQSGSGAWKGKLSISDAFCSSGDPTEKFDGGSRVMAILGAPKPAQARFYLGDETGAPQHGVDKEGAGYSVGKVLRGRKVYLHHQRFSEHSVFPGKDASGQNRSIRDWIPTGRDFVFNIRFKNLTEFELGALIYLLTLNDGLQEPKYFFRLGYGKPLGLGSVILSADIANAKIFSGEGMKSRYLTMDEPKDAGRIPGDKCMEIRGSFITPIKQHYFPKLSPEQEPDSDAMLWGFLKASSGVSGQIAYSQIDNEPNAESFRWFVENESKANYGKQQALPRIGRPLRGYSIEQKGPHGGFGRGYKGGRR